MRHISRQHGPKGFRKQVYELTLEDLRETPVWQFALNEEGEPGQDEDTLRPCPDAKSIRGKASLSLPLRFAPPTARRTRALQLPSKRRRRSPGTFIRRSSVKAATSISGGEACGGTKPRANSRETPLSPYRALKKSPTELFPLRWRMAVSIKGGPNEGELPGFGYVRKTKERGPDGARRWTKSEKWKT